MQNNHITTALKAYLEDLEFKSTHPNEIRGLSTGLSSLDRKIDGIKPGEVILIGGRPAMGKSFFIVNIAYNMALQFIEAHKENSSDDRCVLYFNLGMPNVWLSSRFVSVDSGLSKYDIYKEFNDKSVKDEVEKSCSSLSKMPIYYSNKAYDMEEILDEIKRISADKQVGCVFIDYLQLVQSYSNSKGYAEFLKQIKDFSVKSKIPFIILTQLDSALESRSCKIPLLKDIKGYNKRQDEADKIIFLYREYYYICYNEPEKKKRETDKHFKQRFTEWQERCKEVRDECELIIAKDNNNGFGLIKVKFNMENGRFSDLEPW